jgi:multiple sugar transport system permease protein
MNANQNTGVAAAYAGVVLLVSLASTIVWLRVIRVRREQLP